MFVKVSLVLENVDRDLIVEALEHHSPNCSLIKLFSNFPISRENECHISLEECKLCVEALHSMPNHPDRRKLVDFGSSKNEYNIFGRFFKRL